MQPWLAFIVSATVIMLAGTRLARCGDTIAVRTGLSAAWVGAILVAAATSLPELTTDVYAVRQGNRDLAVADLFGSGMANMAILTIADLLTVRNRLLVRVAINQALVGALAISLTTIAAAGILTGDLITAGPVGWAPVAIVLFYVSGMWMLHANRATPPFETTAEHQEARTRLLSLRHAIVEFAIATGVVLVAARYLAGSAGDIADLYGLSGGFVGLALLAGSTSLPEVAVTLASVRRGAYDLAVGSLLGSNAFNMVILLVLDVVDGPGSLLARVGPEALIGALFANLLMAQVVIDVLNRRERRAWLIEPDAVIRLLTYLLGVYLVYRIGQSGSPELLRALQLPV